MKSSSRHKRRIAIITGSRSEFGLLQPVLHAIKKSRRLEPRLIVTGMHLLPKFGHTIDHIRADGWRIDTTVRMQSGKDDASSDPQAVARGIAGIANALHRLRADMVVVLGDRIEAFAGATAAVLARIPLAHIHGGDRAPGDIDDTLRNAITRLAHIHLVASRDAEQRLKRMGEPANRIHRVGAPGLDDMRRFRQSKLVIDRQKSAFLPGGTDKSVFVGALRRKARTKTDLCVPPNQEAINLRINNRASKESTPSQPYAVIIQHPCGQSAKQESAAMRHILNAVQQCRLSGVILYPNSDPGHQAIVREINAAAKRTNWQVFPSLPRENYLRLLSGAAILIGNSSSGIIESASMGINAVNVGPRQAGRLRCGPSVIDADQTPAAITRAIRKALRMPKPQPRQSIYGDGKAAPRIARILETIKITPDLLHKRLLY